MVITIFTIKSRLDKPFLTWTTAKSSYLVSNFSPTKPIFYTATSLSYLRQKCDQVFLLFKIL